MEISFSFCCLKKAQFWGKARPVAKTVCCLLSGSVVQAKGDPQGSDMVAATQAAAFSVSLWAGKEQRMSMWGQSQE